MTRHDYNMKRCVLYIGLAVAMMASCDPEKEKILPPVTDYTSFNASIEQPTETKVYADENLHLRWNAEDRVSIFGGTTSNQPFRFTGKTGDDAGVFNKIVTDETGTGNSIPHAVSVYPYRENTAISRNEVLTVYLPAVQSYAPDTFAPEANTMVAVSEDNNLLYRNVGGFLVFELYGYEVSVSSITLRGNNNELLAGKATVTMPLDGVPSVKMTLDATSEITLACDTPVRLGLTEEERVPFWIALPPMTFSKGFTIVVHDYLGGTFEYSTSQSVTIDRNTLTRMSPMEVTIHVTFEDKWFKGMCVSEFDRDGDKEISIREAREATTLAVSEAGLSSLYGIQYFWNLTSLKCDSNRLTSLDVSYCKALKTLWCFNNRLTSLDLSNNPLLTDLQCESNRLTSLDVSNNPSLTTLYCYLNELTSLDVSKQSVLKELRCEYNRLTELDLGNTSSLVCLACFHNQLTRLDIDKHRRLVELMCDENQLTSLNVYNNTALEGLACFKNQLTSLDVSNNPNLWDLSCSYNPLTSLDVSANKNLKLLACADTGLTVLDVSNNLNLEELYCVHNPSLTEIWLKTGQTIPELEYDTDVATLMYKP